MADEVLKLVGKETDSSNEDSDPEKEENDFSCSIYVNQFCFRGIDNRTTMAEFFFDNGQVSGNQTTKQVKQFVFEFEIMGAKITAVHLDSGGGENFHRVKLIRLEEDTTDAMILLTENYC